MNRALTALAELFTLSMRRQLVWGVALVHAVMMSLFVYDLSLKQHDFLMDSQTDQAEALVQTLRVTAITPMLSSDLSGLQELVAAVGNYPGVVHVMAIHSSGKILAHSDPSHRGQYTADLARLSGSDLGHPQLLARTEGLVDVVVPVVASGQRLGWVRVGVGQSAAAVRLDSIASSGLLYTALAIVVGVVLAWWLAWHLTRRLLALSRVADTVRSGSLTVRAADQGHDELSHLARAFNFMLDALQVRAASEARLQTALHAEKELAQVTLASIGDAVIATDDQWRVTFLNAAAEKLTGWCVSEVHGLRVQEVFRLLDPATREPLIDIGSGAACLSPGAISDGRPSSREGLLWPRHGSEVAVESSVSPIFATDGQMLGCVLVFRDVSERHRAQLQLQWQAGHDALTQLPNRVLLADRFARAIERCRRQGTQLAVCMLDLDRFKPVNDSYGHEVGDALLVQTAQRLSHELRGVDTLCRLGGDEFVILFEDVDDSDSLHGALERILDLLSQPFEINGLRIAVSASIGMTVFPADDADTDTLMRHADQAMYLAKQSGRNRFHLFDVHQDRQMQSARQTLERVRQALHDGELRVYYQPKVNLRTASVTGFEALLRWEHPQDGLVPPMQFLPLVEQTDIIVDIGEWVIDQALQQIACWRITCGTDWPVSVNIAARQFQRHDFLERLHAILARHPGVSPSLLEFEILESVALADIHAMKSLMSSCQQLGIRFSIDDFGTGYSSLSYLKHLPVETIKIDQSFVRTMLEDRSDLALVGAVILIAQMFSRSVIAEGVETDEQGALLLRLGCEMAQGHGIARPMPAQQVPEWIENFRHCQHGTPEPDAGGKPGIEGEGMTVRPDGS